MGGKRRELCFLLTKAHTSHKLLTINLFYSILHHLPCEAEQDMYETGQFFRVNVIRQNDQPKMSTQRPTGVMAYSSATSVLNIRMQPCDAGFPMRPSSGVP